MVLVLPKLKVFHTRRFACQGCTHFSCSGKRLGSAAAVKASFAKIAEAVCCPWPPSPVVGKRVMMTSGRNFRITHTTSLNNFSRSHFVKVSSGFFEYQKSKARVKNC